MKAYEIYKIIVKSFFLQKSLKQLIIQSPYNFTDSETYSYMYNKQYKDKKFNEIVAIIINTKHSSLISFSNPSNSVAKSP